MVDGSQSTLVLGLQSVKPRIEQPPLPPLSGRAVAALGRHTDILQAALFILEAPYEHPEGGMLAAYVRVPSVMEG